MEWLRRSHGSEDLLSPTYSRALVEVIYTANSMRRHGWHVWETIFRESLGSRELVWRLILRDISARYRQSVLGYLWAILPSVVTVTIFAGLTQSRAMPIGETSLPYVVYTFWSISFWQLFAGSLGACTNSLASAGPLVSKVNFPKEVLVLAAIGQPLLDFLIRLVPLIFVFIWYDVPFKAQMAFLPLILFPAIWLATGLGFFLSISHLVLRDVGNVVSMALTLGMFLAPILYPPPTSWPFSLINILNPFSPLLIASQDIIAYGSLSKPQAFLFSCLFSALIFLFGWRLFRLAMPRVSAYA